MIFISLLLIVLAVLGAPLFTIIATSAMVGFHSSDNELMIIALELRSIAQMPIAAFQEIFFMEGAGHQVVISAPDLDQVCKVTVVAPDRIGLLAAVAGVLTLHRLEVRQGAVGDQQQLDLARHLGLQQERQQQTHRHGSHHGSRSPDGPQRRGAGAGGRGPGARTVARIAGQRPVCDRRTSACRTWRLILGETRNMTRRDPFIGLQLRDDT